MGDEKPKQSKKDIWTLVKEAKDRESKKAPGGGSQSHDAPTPTVALEYRFARSTRGTTKDVAHIWELAGGTFLADLMDIPVSESNIHLTTFVVVADLSEPAEAVHLLAYFLERIEKRTSAILDNLEQRGSKRPKALRAFALKKFGNDHPDFATQVMRILPVPVVIIGSKYDVFRNVEP
ncbi:Cytoplasmic dynein 2 light intermediate chain 1, partial [Blyttiomyces sp. JEL0837]